MGRAWTFIDCTLMEELGEVSPAALRGYEEFIATRIVPDLKRFGKQQNIISQQINDYELLLHEIDTISSALEDGEVKVCIGDDIFATAKLDNREQIVVNVGTGVFVEFSVLEALRFCQEKVYYLKKWLCSVQGRSLDAKTHLDLMLSNFNALRKTMTHQ